MKTVGGLMAVVLFVSIGLAGMRNPTPMWASAVFTVTVSLLCTSVLGAMATRGHARLTWAGLAIFGWSYLVIAFMIGSETNGATPPPFVARAWADYMDDRNASAGATPPANSEPQGEKLIGTPESVVRVKGNVVRLWPVVPPRIDRLNRRRIVHSVGAIAFALLGCVAARFLAARNDEAGGPRPPT